MPCQSKHITYFQLEKNIASLLDLKHVNYESGQIYWDKLYNSAYYDGISWCHILGETVIIWMNNWQSLLYHINLLVSSGFDL